MHSLPNQSPLIRRSQQALGLVVLSAVFGLATSLVVPRVLSHLSAGTPGLAAAAFRLPPHARQVLIYNAGSRLEAQLVAQARMSRPDPSLCVIRIGALSDPTARRLKVVETPTLLRLNARGQVVTRTSNPDILQAQLGIDKGMMASKNLVCKEHLRGSARRLRWIEVSAPTASRVYRRFGDPTAVPDIFRAMSLRPDLMNQMLDLSETGHFSDGFLSQHLKERIATYVSALNGSHYCVGSHAANLREAGTPGAVVEALARGDLSHCVLPARERGLLEFAGKLTEDPGSVSNRDIGALRQLGWRDEQIFEASFDTSLFALFNRIAATYDLDYPPDGWKPMQALREFSQLARA